MILTIWRHGEAGDAATDRQRSLTARGIDEVGRGVAAFAIACAQRADIGLPTRLLHSPWVRTTETARIIGRGLNMDSEEYLPLAPGATPDGLDRALASEAEIAADNGHLLIVSHQPLVSRLIDFYLGAARVVPPLSPGGLAGLSLDPPAAGCATLQFWALPPHYEAC